MERNLTTLSSKLNKRKSNKREKSHNFLDTILDNKWDLLSSFILLLLTIIIEEFIQWEYNTLLLVLFAISYFIVRIFEVGTNKNIYKLEIDNEVIMNELDSVMQSKETLQKETWLQLQNLCNKKLKKIIHDKLQYDASVRANLYIYNNRSKEFFVAGRYSLNKDYNDSRGRFKYPNKKGIIGKAWNSNSNEYFEKFDKWGSEEHKNRLKEVYNYTWEEAEKLTMKSIEYFVFILNNDGDRIGMFLIESTESNYLSKNTILNELNNEKENFLLILSIMINNDHFINLSKEDKNGKS